MFFEKKGVELIGKSAETLRKQHDPSSIPPEISQWISHKFTFVVKVLFKRSVRNMEPSFEVVMIKQRHGKQATLPNIIQSVSNDDLPPLVTISSKQKTDQVYQKIIFCFIHACFIKYIFANYVLAAAIIIIHSSIHRYTRYGCRPAVWVSIFLLFRTHILFPCF